MPYLLIASRLRRPPATLNLAVPTFGEHADRAHTDHDLAGWADDMGNLDPTRRGCGFRGCRLLLNLLVPGEGRSLSTRFASESEQCPGSRSRGKENESSSET
jgi:hypothetical protein